MLNFFIERPVFSTVIALLMILVGTLAAFTLPIAQYPQVVPPQVTVNAVFPGANADVVSQSVAASIEQQVNGAQDMLYMGSKSGNDGTYSLTVTFDIGTDKNIDQIEVQNRVAIAQNQLPAEVVRNGITVRKSTSDFLQVITLTSPEKRYDTVFLSNYALLNLYDERRRAGCGAWNLSAARRKRAQHRQAGATSDERAVGAFSTRHGVSGALQHHALRHRVAEGGREDALRSLRAGRDRRIRFPAELARNTDPGPGGADFAHRNLRRLRRTRLLDQYAHALRTGARHRDRGGRRDRRCGV